MEISKMLLPVILLLLSISVTNAAVSVETFTCNGMSGTVVVENGVAFSCQASIKNEDTQSSANIGSVSLLVNGNWAERTSYTGSDFSTTISAGASTTATFSGIKAVAPGATNKFQSITIDSGSDTYVTNTNVNVIVIKSLTASSPASSAAQNSEFDITATLVAGGDLGSVTLTWSGTGGCAVSSGHTASKDVGALSHNTETTRTWRIVQGSSDCANTITASGTSSSITTTKSKSVTVSVTAASTTTTTTSGGGGGGGGGGGAASSRETKTIKEIKAGATASADFTKTVSSILLEVINDAKNVVISVEEVSTPSVPSLENVYKYLDIKVTNLSDSNIKSASITFSIDKVWLSDKDKNSVRLNRYSNGWNVLTTTLSDENATHVRYKAVTPGFSVFAITAQPPQAAQPQIPTPSEQPGQPLEQPTPPEEPVIIGGIEIPKPIVDYGPTILIVVLIIVAILGWFHYHSPWRHSKYEYRPKK